VQTNATSAAQTEAWLDAFWEKPVAVVATESPADEPRPIQQFPLPEPGTLFLFGMAVVTAVWQRLRHPRERGTP
jgi:hypothetical protein